jgi:hypothetical protein
MDESREDKTLERSKEKLKRDVEKEITKFFDHVLDISEVAIGDPQRYKPFRSKVLRAGNDAIREAKKLLDRNYKVLYVPTSEDVIEVQRPSVTVKKTINS